MVQEKIPDLSTLQDISEYMERYGHLFLLKIFKFTVYFFIRGGLMSESEAEPDTAENKIIVPEDMNSGGGINFKNTTSAIRLTEIGPRLKLKLMKIQEGISDGEVLYHLYMNKTPEEIQKIRENLKKNKFVFFRGDQENSLLIFFFLVFRQKQKSKTQKKTKDENGKEKKTKKKKFREFEVNETEADDEDDVSYFKKEVGIEPAEGFFQNRRAEKRRNGTSRDDYLSKKLDVEGNLKEKNEDAEDEDDGDDDDNDDEMEINNKKQKIVHFDKKPKSDDKNGKPLFLRFSNKKKLALKK